MSERISNVKDWNVIREDLEYFGIAEDEDVKRYIERLEHSKLTARQVQQVWLFTSAVAYAIRHQHRDKEHPHA